MTTLVTGGTGFLGRRLVERLLREGRSVAVLARRPAPDLTERGVRFICASLDDADAVRAACANVDTVFHVAARVGIWGAYDDFFRSNVLGTQALLEGCRTHGVQRVVYTSTPSVVYNGRDLAGADESLPLTTSCPAAYPLTKAIAEREVLAANSTTLRTIALRPHLIWGAGDPHLIPRVIERARAGRLRIVGDGRNRVDLVHVENAVDAHLLAEAALRTSHAMRDKLPSGAPEDLYVLRKNPTSAGASGEAVNADLGGTVKSPVPMGAGTVSDRIKPVERVDLNALSPRPADGRAFFVTNGEPVVLWDWINALLRDLGEPEVKRRISLRAATALGAVCEAAWRALPLREEPPMTRFVAAELAKDHWFDITAARRDLGYNPRVSMADGAAELVASLRT